MGTVFRDERDHKQDHRQNAGQGADQNAGQGADQNAGQRWPRKLEGWSTFKEAAPRVGLTVAGVTYAALIAKSFGEDNVRTVGERVYLLRDSAVDERRKEMRAEAAARAQAAAAKPQRAELIRAIRKLLGDPGGTAGGNLHKSSFEKASTVLGRRVTSLHQLSIVDLCTIKTGLESEL